MYHVFNKHSWEDSSTFNKCSQGLLTNRDIIEIQWIKEDTAAYFPLEWLVTYQKRQDGNSIDKWRYPGLFCVRMMAYLPKETTWKFNR